MPRFLTTLIPCALSSLLAILFTFSSWARQDQGGILSSFEFPYPQDLNDNRCTPVRAEIEAFLGGTDNQILIFFSEFSRWFHAYQENIRPLLADPRLSGLKETPTHPSSETAVHFRNDVNGDGRLTWIDWIHLSRSFAYKQIFDHLRREHPNLQWGLDLEGDDIQALLNSSTLNTAIKNKLRASWQFVAELDILADSLEALDPSYQRSKSTSLQIMNDLFLSNPSFPSPSPSMTNEWEAPSVFFGRFLEAWAVDAATSTSKNQTWIEKFAKVSLQLGQPQWIHLLDFEKWPLETLREKISSLSTNLPTIGGAGILTRETLPYSSNVQQNIHSILRGKISLISSQTWDQGPLGKLNFESARALVLFYEILPNFLKNPRISALNDPLYLTLWIKTLDQDPWDPSVIAERALVSGKTPSEQKSFADYSKEYRKQESRVLESLKARCPLGKLYCDAFELAFANYNEGVENQLRQSNAEYLALEIQLDREKNNLKALLARANSASGEQYFEINKEKGATVTKIHDMEKTLRELRQANGGIDFHGQEALSKKYDILSEKKKRTESIKKCVGIDNEITEALEKLEPLFSLEVVKALDLDGDGWVSQSDLPLIEFLFQQVTLSPR